MSATATLNIRLPEELKEHGMQVLARQHISVSEAVQQLFCELSAASKFRSFLPMHPSRRLSRKALTFANHICVSRPTIRRPLSPHRTEGP